VEVGVRVVSTNGQGHDKIKMLIYGEPGNGKTSLAATLKERVLIVSAEAGLLCLAGHSIDTIDISVDDNGTLVPEEKRIGRLGEVYAYLITQECRDKYDWIFIDSLTEISQNLVKLLNTEFPDRKDSLVLYGENAKRMRSLIKSFRDLPYYNVIFTALSSVEKDENNQRFLGVDMVGKLSSSIPAFFDEVFYLHKGAEERSLITCGSEKLVVKDRSGKLNKQEPANLQVIINKIRGV
jgi:hypothetical protein